MASVASPSRPPATPNEIWEILRETASRQKEHEEYWAELRKERKEEAAREATRREEEAKWRAEEAIREAARREDEAKRREDEAKRRKEEAAREAARREDEAEQRKANAEYEAARREDDAKRREEWAELKELFADTRALVEKNSQEMSRLGHSFGDIVEHLVAPGIEERFEEIGMNLKVSSPPASRKIKENGNTIAEVDLQLENAESVMIVEVKARVRPSDVADHVIRLERLRGWYDRSNDDRKLYGAIAGAVFGLAERRTARKAGFFVMVQSGDTMELDVPGDFKPKEW